MKNNKNIIGFKKLISIMILSGIATFNAVYLTIQGYTIKGQSLNEVAPLPCDLSSTFSCSSIFTYDFSWIFGIPFPLIAIFVYPIIILVAYLGFAGKIKNHFTILFYMGIGGALFNSYFIYHEVLISTYCLLCLACSVIIVSVAIMSKIGEGEMRKNEKIESKGILNGIKNIFK